MTTSPSATTSTASATVYQLRVVLHGVSPLIWRRLLVPSTISIAELHTVLQTAFGWGGEHLHRFVIHGTEYGISYLGTPGFRDDARQVRLGALGLRLGEKFTYTYNLHRATLDIDPSGGPTTKSMALRSVRLDLFLLSGQSLPGCGIG